MDISQALAALFSINEREVTLEVRVNSLAFPKKPVSNSMEAVANMAWQGIPTQKYVSTVSEANKPIGHGRGDTVDEAVQSALHSAECWVRGELSSRENNLKEFKARAEAALAEMKGNDGQQ